MRNLKGLGLALMAVFAFGAFVASATQAAQGAFTQPQGAYPVAITGHEEPPTGTNYIQITGTNGPTTHCENVTYEGTIVESATSITVTPHYTNCISTQPDGSELSVQIDKNGCHYIFIAGTNTSPTDTHGSLQIVCPTGEKMEKTTAGICTTDILPQLIAGGVTFTNIANGDVTIDVDITNRLTYTETDKSFLCPNTNNYHASDGSLVAKIVLTGFEDKGTHTGETVDPDGTVRHYQTVTEGAARDIHVK